MTAILVSIPALSHGNTSVYFSIALCICWLLHRRLLERSNPRHRPYPPGPKPYPFIGNMLDIAKDNETVAYRQLAEKYGDIVFLSVLGKHILFVNSFDTARDLFDKRSVNYSDRPQSIMSHELIGWEFGFSHMRYGEYESRFRFAGDLFARFKQNFKQSVAPNYWPIQRREAHALLRRLLHSAEKLDNHLRHNAAAVVMSITYGITIAEKDDRYITVAEKALKGMSEAASPGAFLVDLLPALKYVPEWLPGASFKRKAREWRDAVMQMRDAPFATALEETRKGTVTQSFVSKLLCQIEPKGDVHEEVETIRNCAGVVYAAASESTVSSLATFVLAMLTHPEVQKRAQEELDCVVGRDRLPEFSDRPDLPYINAILKEVLRWNPVAPLGLPHMTSQEDEYRGYFIPAGTIIVGNTWMILNDPEVFPEPRRFNPDRFMDDKDGGMFQHLSRIDQLSSAFGYGRRFCPGRYIGDAQVWISIACILSVFDITPELDASGTPIEVEPTFSSSGMISHPLPFKFSIKPRSEVALTLIQQTADISL